MAELLATYRDPEAARRAITALERHGIDAADIHLVEAPGVTTPKTDSAMREPDMAVTREVGRRGFATALIGAVVLGGVAAIVGFIVGGAPGALIGGVGFFMAGGALGFFYGGASAVAVSEEWGDTFEAQGPATLAVTVSEDGIIDLRDRIEATRPERIMIS